MKCVTRGNVKQISVSVIKSIFCRCESRFNQSSVTHPLTSAMFGKAPGMNIKDLIKRQKNRLVHFASALKSSRFSRNPTSHASSKDSFFSSHCFETLSAPITFFVRKTKISFWSSTGRRSICLIISVVLIVTWYQLFHCQQGIRPSSAPTFPACQREGCFSALQLFPDENAPVPPLCARVARF